MNPEWGFGEDLYMAEVDAFHQVHCLNVLRKLLIFNYDYYYASLYDCEVPIILETHARHCLSMILQNIMCHADVDIVAHVWHQETTQPYPDFALVRQCRDFDALVRWKEETNLPDAHHKFSTYRRPPGTPKLPTEATKEEVIGAPTGKSHGFATKLMKITGRHTQF